MNRTIFAVLLSFALSSAAFAQFGAVESRQPDTRASKTWEVTKYDIAATLPALDSDRFLSSRATLTLRNASANPVASLTLRINPTAEVAGVKINGAPGDFTKGEEKVGGGTLQRIIIRGVSTAPGGVLNVEVSYKLKVTENNGVGALSSVGSQFLPLSFWYPTPNSWFFARGADFAPTRIQVTASNGLTAVTSGTETGGAFDQKINGQPFLVAGNWDAVSTAGVSVMIPKGGTDEERRHATEIGQYAADARTYFSTVLGAAPEIPVRIVAVRRGSGFSSAGTILLDENVIRRPKLDALSAVTIAESIARMWLGGSVRIDGDGGGVIREGLARFLATQYIESKFGKDVADVERLRQRTSYAGVVKRDAPLTSVSPLDDYYYATNTNKGAMIWRLLAKKVGAEQFSTTLRDAFRDGATDLGELRGAFSSQKELLDYLLDQLTDLDLMAGLPQVVGKETRVNLRNTGGIDVSVDVVATTQSGEKLRTTVSIAKQSFGSAVFTASSPVVRAEIDADKLYPQTDYSDDMAPRLIDETDLLLFAKKPFDKQDYAAAEKNARLILADMPRFDDVRVLLGRTLLALGRAPEAEKEFRTVLDEKLPTGRSLAWSFVGLGEVASRGGQSSDALRNFDAAIRSEADYGATFAARQGKDKLNVASSVDESVRAFFGQFDKAALSAVKSNLEALILPGEMPRFAGGIAGQAQEWTTQVVRVDKLGSQSVIVEVSLKIRMINKEPESGTAVFRLSMVGGNWKLSGVEAFEVR